MIWIILALWVLAYHIDLFSALLVWKTKPNFFEIGETNEFLKRLLKKFSLGNAILLYFVTYSLQNIIIINIAMFFGYWIIVERSLGLSISLSFLFMLFAHILGATTNVYSLFRQDIKVKKKRR